MSKQCARRTCSLNRVAQERLKRGDEMNARTNARARCMARCAHNTPRMIGLYAWLASQSSCSKEEGGEILKLREWAHTARPQDYSRLLQIRVGQIGALDGEHEASGTAPGRAPTDAAAPLQEPSQVRHHSEASDSPSNSPTLGLSGLSVGLSVASAPRPPVSGGV